MARSSQAAKAEDHAQVAATREAGRLQREEAARTTYRRIIEALQTPDDDRWRFMRTPTLATELGVARSTVVHAINPGLATHLDRVITQRSRPSPPADPRDPRTAQLLGNALRYPHALRLARLRLAHESPDHSFVLELKGFQNLYSEHDIAGFMSIVGRPKWSQPEVNRRKVEAAGWVRDTTMAFIQDVTAKAS